VCPVVSRSPPLDFSNAEKLEYVEFNWGLTNVWWITASLQTVKSKYLRQIDMLQPEWGDLDRLLTQLWISRSVLPKVKYNNVGSGLDLEEIAPILLPELTRRGLLGELERK
jgi:hypothetical protein